ncbi:hypothetical protein [Mesorhizobium sp. L-8-3]|uniref:hypothetical protein n=1 Tax=Mesorhizobium sp. L-8-3 TaxID=2744522 RepID=UPI00192960ED|nr:hypothetical protein [Mesorhizobium sp. L-8-3]BCH24282.1 hypothetical protein MesoLjLb_40670 [Mesorhizobium sp. L-8-3]
MAFPSYMRPAEQKIVEALIKKALGLHYVVSVYDGEDWDGEDWPVIRSIDYEQLTAEVAVTDESQFIFRRKEDSGKVGWLMLVHGNDEDVICDYSDTPLVYSLVEGVDA